MTPVLHVEPRPWTSPCALCPASIPLTQTVSLANPDRDTVRDSCGETADPAAFAALGVLRAMDAAWWAVADRGLNPAARIADGMAVLTDWYGAGEPERSFTFLADRSELASYPQNQPTFPQ